MPEPGRAIAGQQSAPGDPSDLARTARVFVEIGLPLDQDPLDLVWMRKEMHDCRTEPEADDVSVDAMAVDEQGERVPAEWLDVPE